MDRLSICSLVKLQRAGAVWGVDGGGGVGGGGGGEGRGEVVPLVQ